MMADKLKELEDAEAWASTAFDDAERRRDEEIYAAKRRITEAHAPKVKALEKAMWAARQAVRDFKSATASHPWEGQKVVYEWEVMRNRWDASKGTYTKRKFGFLEVRRIGTEFPANMAGWRIPGMGQPFVRQLKKDGTPGLQIFISGPEAHVNNWKLAEEESE
jgi:hypothetical protein